MALRAGLSDYLGLGAAAAILAVGAFVLAARPAAARHRLFFALCAADALSTAAFQLRNMSDDGLLRSVFMEWYWVSYIAFIALLLAFGITFPVSPMGARGRAWILATIGALALAAIASFLLSPEASWKMGAGPTWRVTHRPVGAAVLVAYALAIAVVIATQLAHAARGRSVSHRRQSAFLLAGITIAYAPSVLTFLVEGLRGGVAAFLFPTDMRALFLDWAYLAVAASVLAIPFVAVRLEPIQRRVTMAACLVVVGFTLVSLWIPDAFVNELLLTLALLAYPILLGYAIERFEVFEIHVRLRRAAAFSVGAALLAGVFVLALNVLQEAIATNVGGVVASNAIAGGVAALLTALVSWWIARLAKRIARRMFPDLSEDEDRARRLEVYRHALEGALSDGQIDPSESGTLQALRRHLGITADQHESILFDVRGVSSR